MGLDNGINIKFRNLKENVPPKLIKKLKYFDREPYENNDYTIFYWRKCENIKSLFKDFCNKNGIKYQDGNNTYLTIDETIKFIECLLSHHNKKWWNETSNYGVWFCNSFWSWDEVKSYKYDYKDALKLFKYFKKLNMNDKYYIIYFFDSY